MRRINKKINELYITKSLVLQIPYRKKIVSIDYMVISCFGTEMEITLNLRSKKYPCPVPKLETISMVMRNEFPTEKLRKSISQKDK